LPVLSFCGDAAKALTAAQAIHKLKKIFFMRFCLF